MDETVDPSAWGAVPSAPVAVTDTQSSPATWGAQPASAEPSAPALTATPKSSADILSEQLFSDTPPKQKGTFDEDVGTAEYILNQAKLGLAAGPLGGFRGDILSLLPRKASLVQMVDPMGIAMLFAKHFQDQGTKPGQPPPGTSEDIASKLLGYKPGMKAPDEATGFAGGVTQFATGGITAPIKSLVKEGAPAALRTARELLALSTAATAGGEVGQQMTDSPLGGFAGTVLSVPAYAYLRKLPSTVRFAKNVVSEEGRTAMSEAGSEFLKPIIERKVEQTLAEGLKEGGAKTISNIEQAAATQSAINRELAGEGRQVTMSAGQASGAPRIVDAELEARKSSYTANAAAKQIDERNAASILTYMQRPEHPLTQTVKGAVDGANAKFNTDLEALRQESDAIRARAARVPELLPVERTAEERGRRLAGLAVEEKVREDVVRDKIYNAVSMEAQKVNAKFDPSLVNEASTRLMSNPILQYDSTNAPSVVKKIAEVQAGIIDTGSRIILPQGTPVPQITPKVRFNDIQAMETAVNQDIASEMAAAGPNTRQRLRALTEMKAAIQGAVAESEYPQLKRLYAAATNYYRDTYSPRFNTGINAKLWMRDNYGDNKILDENVLDAYMKNKNNANRFVSLFGKNPEALAAMQDHVFDRFKTSVVKDGVVDPKAFDTFLRKNSDMLQVLQKSGLPTVGKMNNVREMTQRFSDQAANLTLKEGELANGNLAKAFKTNDVNSVVQAAMNSPQTMGRLMLSMDQQGAKAVASKIMRDIQDKITYPAESGKVGLNSQAMSQFLNDNATTLKILYRKAYGPEEGAAHFNRLQTAYRMMAIQDRVRLPQNITEPSAIGKDPLKASTGVAVSSLWSMFRAVARGVNSPQNVAIVLGGQSGSFYLTRAYNKLMQSIATDPESSKYLLTLAKNGGKGTLSKAELAENAKAMAGTLGKLGYFWVGGKYYGPSLSMIFPGAMAEAEQENRQTATH